MECDLDYSLLSAFSLSVQLILLKNCQHCWLPTLYNDTLKEKKKKKDSQFYIASLQMTVVGFRKQNNIKQQVYLSGR